MNQFGRAKLRVLTKLEQTSWGKMLSAVFLQVACLAPVACICVAQEARQIEYYGYQDCILLENQTTRVVLCPAAGGRVLEYALHGKNVLYLPPGNEGWTWDGRSKPARLDAGRFDIGPEQMVARRPMLWQGRWNGEITGKYSARLTSQADSGPGVYLVREFQLAERSSRLTCTQTFVSTSEEPVELCHWSRTFAVGHGTCIVPLSQHGRFPNGFVRYDPPGKMLNMKPEDAHVRRNGDFLVVSDRPENPKLGFDSMERWLAYLAPENLLFVKTFPTFPGRAYNEVAGLTISIWYPDGDMVELEPIGPRERLEQSGDRASFTETWYLVEQSGVSAEQIDVQQIAARVKRFQNSP